ncbi:MAG: oligosaccharide repeat unit polymerase [Dolichospermum sp. DEX182a]|nr:oligosaccharide repeat unit polymerase [Dolichospermum sp. DEX182a]
MFYKFITQRPLLTFLIIYITSLILNRLNLLDMGIYSEFSERTWLVLFVAIFVPTLGFTISSFLFINKRHQTKENYILNGKVSLYKLKVFYCFAFLISLISFLLNIYYVYTTFGVLALENASETYQGLASISEDRIPGAGSIKQISYSLPILLAFCQILATQSECSQKTIGFFNKVVFVTIALNSISSLIVSSRFLVIYPIVLYFFTYNSLSFIVINKSDQKKNKNLLSLRRLYPYIIITLIGVSIMTISSVRSEGGYKIKFDSNSNFDNPIFQTFENLYAYNVAGFDVINERMQLSERHSNIYIPECYLRPVIPGYVRMFGEGNQDCSNRFNLNGHTSLTYLTPFPIDNIYVTSFSLLIFGLIWGYSYRNYKTNIVACIIFCFMTVGMIFSAFTNVVLRDYVFVGIAFLYPAIFILKNN